jgi:hypothetical protein
VVGRHSDRRPLRAVFAPTGGGALLALPEDERWLTTMLKDRYGLALIHSQLGGEEVGGVIADPDEYLPNELPAAARRKEFMVAGMGTRREYDEPWGFDYWRPEAGPLDVRQQPPPPRFDTHPDWPLRQMLYPSPTLRLDRTYWHLNGQCLIAGALSTGRDHARFYEASMAAVAAECEEFAHDMTAPFLQDAASYGPIYALPAAAEFLRAGGNASAVEFI